VVSPAPQGDAIIVSGAGLGDTSDRNRQFSDGGAGRSSILAKKVAK